MSKHSSDSNSRDRNRSRNRHYNQRHRSSSSSSTESSRHSRKHNSSRSRSRYYKKSKYRHRSNSSSDYSSRHKHSSRTNLREEYHSKKLHRRRNSSSSNESTSNGYSNVSSKFTQSKNSKTFNDSENALPNSSSYSQSDVSEVKSKDQSDSLFQQTVYDTLKMENSIEEINQEGFVFKVFKPSSEQKDGESNDFSNFNSPKLNEDIINSLPVEKSTFVIINRDSLLSARHKLLTKQERCLQWAKYLFSYNEECENETRKDD